MSPLKQGFGQSALHHLGTREYCPQDILLILNSYLWNFYYFLSNYVVLRVLAFMYYMDGIQGYVCQIVKLHGRKGLMWTRRVAKKFCQ